MIKQNISINDDLSRAMVAIDTQLLGNQEIKKQAAWFVEELRQGLKEVEKQDDRWLKDVVYSDSQSFIKIESKLVKENSIFYMSHWVSGFEDTNLPIVKLRCTFSTHAKIKNKPISFSYDLHYYQPANKFVFVWTRDSLEDILEEHALYKLIINNVLEEANK